MQRFALPRCGCDEIKLSPTFLQSLWLWAVKSSAGRKLNPRKISAQLTDDWSQVCFCWNSFYAALSFSSRPDINISTFYRNSRLVWGFKGWWNFLSLAFLGKIMLDRKLELERQMCALHARKTWNFIITQHKIRWSLLLCIRSAIWGTKIGITQPTSWASRPF